MACMLMHWPVASWTLLVTERQKRLLSCSLNQLFLYTFLVWMVFSLCTRLWARLCAGMAQARAILTPCVLSIQGSRGLVYGNLMQYSNYTHVYTLPILLVNHILRHSYLLCTLLLIISVSIWYISLVVLLCCAEFWWLVATLTLLLVFWHHLETSCILQMLLTCE